MDIIIDQEVSLDEALVPHASRLTIGKSNFRLRSNLKSKESTLQVVYDVLKLTPFYKAFLVVADVPEIYMQEFWATATVHHHSIRFKINNKKRIVNLEYFREMIQICPRIPNQQNSESYKEYYAIASEAEPPKTEASVRKKQSSSDTTVLPPTTKGKRLKTLAKVDKPAKEKQPAKSSKAKGLTVLSEVALTKAEQIKLGTKKSLTQTHISHASGSGADEGTDDNDDQDDQSDDDDQNDQDDDDDEQTDSDNDDDEDNDEDSHGMNVKRDEGVNEEDEANELYRDVNINLEDQDIQMEYVQTTQVIEDTHVTLTLVNPEGQQQSLFVSSRFVSNILNPSLNTSIDSIFESTPRVDVSVTTTVEPPLLSTTTLPPPSIPIISHVQQTPAPSPANIPSLSLQDLPNFTADLSELELKKIIIDKMESNKSIHISDEQKNLYKALVDAYECDKLILDTYEDTVTLKRRRDDVDKDEEPSAGSKRGSKRRRAGKEPESTNAPKEKTSKTSGKSTEGSKSHHKTASDNKSIHRSDEQKNLYKALVEAYEFDKIILDTYEDIVTLKRRHDDDADKDEEPFAGSNRGSNRRRVGKEPESTSAPKEKTSKTSGKSTEEFVTGATDDQPVEEASQHLNWFQKQAKPPTPDRAWNKTLSVTHGRIQPWINNLAKKADSRTSFNELMDTPIDFSAFMMNRLKVDALTPELLAGPTYELVKGSCKSLVELEFFLEEVYKETTDQLDWNNPKG
uniref:Uncharacterized protein n=1 Tax=Tanacetum cinerariifolium TaxID=118510 RepID=A0A699HL56_TANCI|nr:hypothetical protein [Tanacetum cinerariifolium]